jgi:hypothetical protein
MQVRTNHSDDVTMPLNPSVVTVDLEKLEEAMLEGTPLDEVFLEVNVSQRSREDEPSRRVVRTRVDCSVWDH